MSWTVRFHDAFEDEFEALAGKVQDELLANARLLSEYGPHLGRPHADTLKNSAYANMKELRFRANGGVWRTAFAFDPNRMGILLAAGDKSGVGEARFYRLLIAKADLRYRQHLESVTGTSPPKREKER